MRTGGFLRGRDDALHADADTELAGDTTTPAGRAMFQMMGASAL
jgi:chloramphenicol 3-O-phosphotransferase